VNVSPVASARDESVILSAKPVAVFVVDASVAVDVGVAVAMDWPGAVPLMTGPFGDISDCLLVRVWAKTPASIPVAAQVTIISAATNSESWECKGGLDAMNISPSLSGTGNETDR
jgi:hypothetical protein